MLARQTRGNAEPRQPHAAACRVHQDVGRLEVAVDDAVLVGVLHRPGQRLDQGGGVPRRQRPAALPRRRADVNDEAASEDHGEAEPRRRRDGVSKHEAARTDAHDGEEADVQAAAQVGLAIPVGYPGSSFIQ